ncbi:MAG: hypothetical protein HW380_2736 [Magnetococcales bacterium]|nr:hypothetical protein [Magnetococcales bacterium]HIJ85095.1 hypothetical protein [Magnetococcales bacterium]
MEIKEVTRDGTGDDRSSGVVPNPFPYKIPIDYEKNNIDTFVGNGDLVVSLFHLADVILGIYQSRFRVKIGCADSSDIRLDGTVFRLCLDFTARRLTIIQFGGQASSEASVSGHAEWPHTDSMTLFGAEVGASIVRFRPLQFVGKIEPRDPLLLYINELFALEFGWVVCNWMIRNRDDKEFFYKKKEELFKHIIHDVMSLRTMSKKVKNMFQFLATEGASSSVLAVFYDSLPKASPGVE